MTNPRPSAPPPPSEETDATRVRVRRPDGSLPPATRQDVEEVGEHADRVTRKLATARILLASLPVSHPQSGLLRVAILRRDETLLDGLLAGFERRQSQFPMQRTTVPPGFRDDK
ncbi:MAG: hypothetical protein SFV15_05210 [Polyangiaceae bacterium]|nr:hypothetical protein [Polyangiaceae bacterium]